MAGFSNKAKVEIKVDQEKLDHFIEQMERIKASIDEATIKASEVLKQMKEVGDTTSKKVNDAAKELNKAVNKAQNVKSLLPSRVRGGRQW